LPESAWAGFWGLLAGSALLLGAAVGDFIALGKKTIAYIMAFGSGVLISALSFDLMAGAYRGGGFDSTSAGFLGGAIVYSVANCCCPNTALRPAKDPAVSSLRKRINPVAALLSQSGHCWTASPNPW
jgi:zinc transporter, ZIP family